MLVENYSNSRSLLSHKTVEAIFSDLRVEPSGTYLLTGREDLARDGPLPVMFDGL